MPRPSRPRSEVDDVLDEGDTVDIQALAKEHAAEMVGVLVQGAKSVNDEGNPLRGKAKVPWSVRAKAAKDVVEIAEGRPATKEIAQLDTGLTIVVQTLIGEGRREEKVILTNVAGGNAHELRETHTMEVDDLQIVSEPLLGKGGEPPCERNHPDSEECQEVEVEPSIPHPSDKKDPSQGTAKQNPRLP